MEQRPAVEQTATFQSDSTAGFALRPPEFRLMPETRWRTRSDAATCDFFTVAMSPPLTRKAAVEEFSISTRIIMRMDDEIRLRFGSREFLEQELVRVARVSTNDERVSGGNFDE